MQEALVVVVPLVQEQVLAWPPDTEYTTPTDPHTPYVTEPVYPLAHDTPPGEKPEVVTVSPAPVKS